MTIAHFMSYHVDNTPFLHYKGTTLSRSSFIKKIKQYIIQISKYTLNEKSFIYLSTEDPIEFYSLLIALWSLKKCVLFPTKQTLLNQIIPSFAQYECNSQNNIVKITYSKYFEQNITIPTGDTIVYSSGSTGSPKGIVHSHEHFFKNAYRTYKVLQYNNLVSVTFLPPYLVSALSHFLVHWYANSFLIFDTFNNMYNIGQYKNFSSKLCIVGSPFHISSGTKALQEKSIIPKMFFSSGDMISTSIIEHILTRYPTSTFYKVYGLAEVAGRLFINKITSSTIDNSEHIGYPIEQMKISYLQNEVVVKGDTLFHGYILDNIFIPHQGDFLTGDIVSIKNNFIILLGRKNDEIKIMGNKVSLKYLENKIATLLSHFKLTLIILIPIKHKIYGNILGLIIDKNLPRDNIIQQLRQGLKSYEIPHKFFYISRNHIPFTQTMKIDRNELKKMIEKNLVRLLND